MKRGAGFLALFAFLLTGIRFARGPAAIRETSEVSAAEAARPEPKMPAHQTTACPAFELPSAITATPENAQKKEYGDGEIAELIDRFVYGTDDSNHLQAGGLPEGIRLMIVTIPDPRHTHLSLQFDRTLEAIQQAAQDEKYTYDSSWLPWKSTSTESGNLAERKAESQESARLEACPGLLLFRKSMSGVGDKTCKEVAPGIPLTGNALFRCGMLIFVIAEKPTDGLNRTQWDNALRWIDKYANKTRPDKVLRVLGPNFSGSMPSFVRALEPIGMYTGTFSSTLLYSGRIRGCASWRWLQRELNPPLAPATPPPTTIRLPVRISDFEENDALQSDRFYRYLEDRGHRLSEVAVLSEDETTYGGLPDAAARLRDPTSNSSADTAARSAERQLTDQEGSCSPDYSPTDRPVHLYYPRDISALRSAYQEQSIFSGSKGDNTTPHTVLRDEPPAAERNDTDTVQLFSGTNIALTQEAQMYGIVNTLKTHGIRYIILRSTNSLDYLFLTRFLHRAYPEAYIVTMGTDLLFGREVDSTEFRGVVALSSFPLLPRGQDWTQQVQNTAQHAHRVFGGYTMEGGYLATRYLITDPDATSEETHSTAPFQHAAKSDIPDYAFPFWDRQEGLTSQPATWLAVIGRDGYWPLATLNEQLGNTKRFSNLAQVVKSQSQSSLDSPNKPRQLSLSSSWRFFCVLALLVFGMHYFACRYGYSRPDLGMFVQFTRFESCRGPALIAASWAVICSLLMILFLTSARIADWLDSMDKVWVLIMGVATAAACALALVELKWWSKPLEQAPGQSSRRKNRKAGKAESATPSGLRLYSVLAASMLAAIVLFAAAGWLIFEFGRPSESAVTTAYRSVHLTSGVSPVVALIALLAGFYWWFWQSLAGLALLGDGRPVLPRSVQERLSKVGNQLADGIERAAMPFPPFEKQTFLLYLLPLFLVLLVAVVLQGAWMQVFDMVLHTMENAAFNRTFHVLVAIALYLILLEAMQFYSTWLVLKRLLQALDRYPLRRTFAALQGLSMRSLWRFSGTSSRARYKIFSRQMESLLHLRNEMDSVEWPKCGTTALHESVRTTWQAGRHFIGGRLDDDKDFAMVNDVSARAIRLTFRDCTEMILEDLLVPEWEDERSSLAVHETPAEGAPAHEGIKLSDKPPVQAAEEFVCLTYVGYLQNLLGRMRTMVLSMVGIFAAIALSVGFYPFTPRPTISIALLLLLLMIGVVVGSVFAGLDRDSTLSHITNTEPGALGSHFWLRMLSFIGVPALGLIVAQFPEITDFVFSWITPTMSSMK
jgi:hypothetical protein